MGSKNSDQLKSIIRSLLVSNPKRATVRDFCKDFVEFNGYAIPYRSMGFQNAEEYLRSIPDVCQVFGNGPMAFIEPVVQKQSAHINAMVCKQKVTSNKRSGTEKRRRTLLPEDLSLNHSNHNNNSHTRRHSSTPNHRNTQTQLLLNTPIKLSTPVNGNIRPDDWSIRTPIPAAGNTVPQSQNSFRNISENSSRTINNLDTNCSPVSSLNAQNRSCQSNLLGIPETSSQQNSDSNVNKATSPRKNYTYKLPRLVSSSSNNDNSNSTSTSEVGTASNKNDWNLPDRFVDPTTSEVGSTNNKNDWNLPRKCHDSTTSEVGTTGNNNDSKLPHKFNDLNRKLAPKNLCINPNLHPANSLSRSPKIKNTSVLENSDLLSGADTSRRPCFQGKTKLIFDEKYPTNIPKEVWNNLKRLIEHFPQGILGTELQDEYCKMFRKDLRFEKYKYRSLIELCSDLPEIFHYIRLSDGDFMLFDKNQQPLENNNNNNSIDAEIVRLSTTNNSNREQNSREEMEYCNNRLFDSGNPHLSLDLEWSSGPTSFPLNVMTVHNKISQQIEGYVTGDFIDICVTQIENPHDFWIHPRRGAVDKLMKDLREVYTSHNSELYEMREGTPKVGLYCAALYEDNYCRAIITDLNPDDPEEIEIQLIDFGTYVTLRMKDLYFLPKPFGYLPHQAVRARLSNIEPSGVSTLDGELCWSTRCIQRFEELTENDNERELVGEIIKIHRDERILELRIGDVTDLGNVFFIHDVLVKEGLGIFPSR